MTADKQGPAGGAVPEPASPRVQRPLRGVLYVLVALVATATVAVIVTMFAFFLSFYSWMAGAAVAAGGLVLAIPVWRWRGSRSAAGALAAGSIIAAAALLPVWRSEYAHDQALSDLENRPCDGAVPPRTEILECGGSVSLTGNGNHCDYQAWMVMSSRLTNEELVAFFQGITIRGIGGQALPFAWRTELPTDVAHGRPNRCIAPSHRREPGHPHRQGPRLRPPLRRGQRLQVHVGDRRRLALVRKPGMEG